MRWYPSDYLNRLSISRGELEEFMNDADANTSDWKAHEVTNVLKRAVERRLNVILDKFMEPHPDGICPKDPRYEFDMLPDFTKPSRDRRYDQYLCDLLRPFFYLPQIFSLKIPGEVLLELLCQILESYNIAVVGIRRIGTAAQHNVWCCDKEQFEREHVTMVLHGTRGYNIDPMTNSNVTIGWRYCRNFVHGQGLYVAKNIFTAMDYAYPDIWGHSSFILAALSHGEFGGLLKRGVAHYGFGTDGKEIETLHEPDHADEKIAGIMVVAKETQLSPVAVVMVAKAGRDHLMPLWMNNSLVLEAKKLAEEEREAMLRLAEEEEAKRRVVLNVVQDDERQRLLHGKRRRDPNPY